VTFQFSDVDSSDASVRGENWDEEYIFAKGQFQWSHNFLDGVGGAGHRVNGRVYPVEMELLHYRRSDGSLEKAWTTGGVLILSILMRVSPFKIQPLLELCMTSRHESFDSVDSWCW